MEEINMLYKKFQRIADDFYAGKSPNEILTNDSEEDRFIEILKTYRANTEKLSEDSNSDWHGHKVISEQFPPMYSDMEKNFLIRSMIFSPVRQKSITVAITYKCRCKCKQCYITDYIDPTRKEMTLEQFKPVFKKITDIGAWHIDITGGEPFDHPQFFEVMNQIPKDKATTMVATNGINFNEETVEKIKNSNIMVLKVSLDSYKKSVHDKNRAVKDAFDHVVNGIKLLIKNKIYVFVQAFVERDCWKDNELEKRIQICLDLGIKKFHIITPLNIGNLKHRQDLLLTYKDREYIYSLRYKYKDYNIRINVFPDWELERGCLAGRGRIYINPYGDVFPCNFDKEKSYGNIITDDLPAMVKAMHMDIPERRKYCVASNVTLDLLESLNVTDDLFGKHTSSFIMNKLFKPIKNQV